ncbi:YchJ family metal-binding protein [Oceaniserpentilla sp. 4NH20-0058]|uniref:YchJ family protein n=1 Tax=Oceaniserpentilla sp. 4NH20-0058 TaxID=3127660 RepID=UPI003342C7C4
MQQPQTKVYAQCCEPFHLGEVATTPEQLMRSRFSGFALGLTDYIAQTWHPSTRPQDLTLSPDDQWIKLDIVQTKPNWVHFRAYFNDPDSPSGWSVLDEQSNFINEGNRWFYVKGNTQIEHFFPARNDACLCGSSKKYKKCCQK